VLRGPGGTTDMVVASPAFRHPSQPADTFDPSPTDTLKMCSHSAKQRGADTLENTVGQAVSACPVQPIRRSGEVGEFSYRSMPARRARNNRVCRVETRLDAFRPPRNTAKSTGILFQSVTIGHVADGPRRKRRDESRRDRHECPRHGSMQASGSATHSPGRCGRTSRASSLRRA
jgi:hypothetical protein